MKLKKKMRKLAKKKKMKEEMWKLISISMIPQTRIIKRMYQID
jgi:hypothetical protein